MKSTINKTLLMSLLLFGLSISACKKDGGEEPTTEPTEEPTEEPKEEPKEEPTEEPTEEPKEEPAAAEVDESMFIKAYYETTCVQAKIEDPAKQKEIIKEIQLRYGFESDEAYKTAETAVASKENVKIALKSRMEKCTSKEIAEGFAKAGAAAEGDTAAAGGSCADRFKSAEGFKVGDGFEVTCKCSADATKAGTVWGVGTYTTDSSICKAAVHAGVIKAEEGGEVTAKGMAGCKSYEGSEANGVTSSKWGSYDGSFFFPSAGEVACAGEKKPETKKPALKYKVGNMIDRGIRSGDIQQGEFRVALTNTGKVTGYFKGKREGKFFNLPLSGRISKDGNFTATGRMGKNSVTVKGKATTKAATGSLKGKINQKDFKISFSAK